MIEMLVKSRQSPYRVHRLDASARARCGSEPWLGRYFDGEWAAVPLEKRCRLCSATEQSVAHPHGEGE
jgi:hypothetical protein